MVKGHLWCNVLQSQIGMRLHGYMYICVQHGYYNTALVITSVFMQLSQQGPWEKVAASSKISDCLLHQSVLLSQMCLVLMEASYKQSLSSQRKLHNSRTDIRHFSMLQNTNTLASSNKQAAKSFSPGTSAGKWLGHNGTKFKAICRIRRMKCFTVAGEERDLRSHVLQKRHSPLNLPELIRRSVRTTTLRGSEPVQHEGNICDQTRVGWFDSIIRCQEQQGDVAGSIAASHLHSHRFNPELGSLVLHALFWVWSRFSSFLQPLKTHAELAPRCAHASYGLPFYPGWILASQSVSDASTPGWSDC